MPITQAYAQGEAAAAGFDPIFLVLMVGMIAVFWFLVIRPQSKQRKQHQAMLQSIKRGDHVVTNGGIMGRVARIDGDGVLTVEIADGVKVRCRHMMIAEVMSKAEPRSSAQVDDKNSSASDSN